MWWNKSTKKTGTSGVLEQLRESLTTFYDDYVDPREDDLDPITGERWRRIGVGVGSKDNPGLPQSEAELAEAREQCRSLAVVNEFAINGHENRISYIVGSGHSYNVQWKKGKEPEKAAEAEADPTIDSIKAAIDRFVQANGWQQRQQEIVRRCDRDGECFLRLFPGPDGITRVRFVEPAQVATPSHRMMAKEATFGIETDPEDVETVTGYWVDGKLIDAAEIQHRKVNVDANVKRGLPLFYPVRKNLRRVEKLLRNMSVVAEIQSAIAIIRKHQGATKSGVEQFISGNADVTHTSEYTGKTNYFRKYGPGTILDSSNTMEYEFPAAGIDAGRYVQVLQAELRAIASRLVMPEFMLSSDASNANYSSTMVAEGPAVKMFQRLQFGMIEYDLDIIRKALMVAGISEDTLDLVEIVAQPPNIQTRDRLKDAQADFILNKAGALSAETMMERNDLDPDVEKERLAEERAEQIMGSAGTSTPTTPNPRPNQPEPEPVVIPAAATESRAKRAAALLWEGYP